ncbi:MAG: hypothetical protein ACI837_001173 [Crocinitomicaceae bacterium]|jgi:hypothetical protein
MIRILLLTVFTSTLMLAQAHRSEVAIIPYWLDTSVEDPSLSAGESVYEFNFQNGSIDGKTGIIYSIDGITQRTQIVGNVLIVKTTPGKHIFQVYYSGDFEELYTDSLVIRDGYRDSYNVNLMIAYDYPVLIDKPVIYLYPEKETVVSVDMDIKGDVSFTYPQLDGTWDFIAHPNGDLVFDDNTYNYLFWESQQDYHLSSSELEEGFVVTKAEVVSFLEEKLTEAGLSSKEQADFITYWGPRLTAHEMTFVRFEFNETCNRYAELRISPKPDNIYRIYISWMPIYQTMNVSPQKIEKMTRKGFTVLEWGGFEAKPLLLGSDYSTN